MFKIALGICAAACGVLLVVGTYLADGNMHAIPGLFLAFVCGIIAQRGLGDLGRV